MKYPIGIQAFEKLRNESFLYIDKTDLVWQLAQMSICFLCRPRRFGKSLLISTLDCYFRGKKHLFEGLKIMEMEQDWKEYPVFRIDFATGGFHQDGKLERLLEGYVAGWEAQWGKDPYQEDLGARFVYVLRQAHEKTGLRCVVLIDEYDKPLLDVLDEPQESENRNVLKTFYGTFKAADEHLRFVLLTGVTKFSQVSVFSGFNQPYDISLDSKYEKICGITEEELHTCFAESIAEMAAKYKVDVTEMKNLLKQQYDGYHFSENLTDIYNPFSIVNAFSELLLKNYWFTSGTPTYLVKLIGGHHVNIQRELDRDYRAEDFANYRADSQQPIPMLYQSGYLTIKSYDLWSRTYKLDFPNQEVGEGFLSLVATDYLRPAELVDNWIINVGRMLRSARLDDLRDAFTSFLASIPYEANKNQIALNYETHYQYTFYLIFRLLSCYTTLIEKQNSHGRADIVIETPDYVYVFEFKLDGTAEEALKQIEDKGYAQPYLSDTRPLYRIGAVISSQTRTVSEWKVES